MKSIFPDGAIMDLYDNGKQNFDIGAKGNCPLAMYNFKLVEPETFGGGKLIGAEVDLYLNSINKGWNGTDISGIKVYKDNNLITTEGGSSGMSCIGKEGADIYSLTSYVNTNSSAGSLIETFEQTVYGKVPNSTLINGITMGSAPYLPLRIAWNNGLKFGNRQTKSSWKKTIHAFGAGIGVDKNWTPTARQMVGKTAGTMSQTEEKFGKDSAPAITIEDTIVPLVGHPNHTADASGARNFMQSAGLSYEVGDYHIPGNTIFSYFEMPLTGKNKEEKFKWDHVKRHVKFAGTYEAIPDEIYEYKEDKSMSASNTFWDVINTHSNRYGREPITTTMNSKYAGLSMTPEHSADIALQARANIYPWKVGGTTSNTSMCMEAYYCAPHVTQGPSPHYGSGLFDSKNPLSQEISAVKSGIPAPIVMQSREKSGNTGSTPADTALLTPVVAPTIELQLKISRMAEVFKQEGWVDDTSSSMDNKSDMEIRLNRFFAVCLSERAPESGESFYDFYKDMADNTKNCFGTFFYERDGKTMVTDFTELAASSAGNKFDTRHKELCINHAEASLVPTVENAVDLKDKWMTLQYECSPNRDDATNDGKLIRTIFDSNTTELLYPVRAVASMSGETDLQANWPGHFSVWLVNTPPCGGKIVADEAFAADYLDSSFVLDMEMAADDDDGAEINVRIKKRVRNDAYAYENVDGQGLTDAFHFRVGEKVRLGTETMTVMDRYITTAALSSGNATGTGNYSYLTLKRKTGGTKSLQRINTRIYRQKATKTDLGMRNKDGSKIKLFIDSIKFTGFNNSHINSTNNTVEAFDSDITILPETELVARRPLHVTEQTSLAGSTEWSKGTLITNPCYGVGNQYISFGFQTLTNLTGDDTYLFFSGFDYGSATNTESINTTPWSNYSRTSALRAGYSDGAVTNGGQYKNEVFMNKSAVRATNMRGLVFHNSTETDLGGSTSYPNIIHSRDGAHGSSATANNNLNFCEMWTQNGILKIKDDLWDTSISGDAQYLPIKRENIFTSARILKIIDEKTIEVDTTVPLMGNDTEDYIIYKYGAAYGTGTRRTTARPAASSDPEASGNSLRISSMGGNRISFPVPILLADDGATTLLSEANLPLMMISPRRAWVIFEFSDGTEEVRQRIRMPERTYESVTQIVKDGSGNLPVAGPTFTESQFTDGLIPLNPVKRDIFDPISSTIELKTDYGFGAMSDSSGSMDTVGHLGITKLNSSHVSKYNTLDISGLVTVDGKAENDEVGLFYTPASSLQSGLLNFDSEDGTNPPKHWSVFFDELPSISKFGVNAEKSNSFSPFYEWEIDADDAWYGILIASDKMIASQYHNSVAHIPLDEDATTFGGIYSNTSTAATAGTFTNYKGGLAGWTKRFNGSSNYIKFGHAAISTKPTNKMSVVAHIVPNNTPSGDEYIIFKDDGAGSSVAARTEFAIYINSSGQVGAKIVSGAITYSLLSHSIIPTDGYTPTNIVLTVDGEIKSENIKLFLNGQLEDNTGARRTTGTVNNWQTGASIAAGVVTNNDLYIGAATTDGSARANFFDGNIEEIVIYNDVIYPVSPELGNFTLQKPFKEQNNGSVRPITARLFIKDYHNIRGSSTSQVAASSMVSFSKPSFNLYG